MTDTPTDEDIRSALAQALPYLSHAEEIEYVASYLVTGSPTPMPGLVGRQIYRSDGRVAVGVHCTNLIMWARHYWQWHDDFTLTVHVTSKYYALKQELKTLSHETP
jgi:hypothetical protein